MKESTFKKITRLNGICPYFTMFPLKFPYKILMESAKPEDWVADPFCGRGTTNYASRILGLPSIGIDSSPVAVAISEAKLADTNPENILKIAKSILATTLEPEDMPSGDFWDLAYHPKVLKILCRLREGLLKDCSSQSHQALRGLILGALHGPRKKIGSSYFSNQSPRTFAPKPAYAVKFWKERNLIPEEVDVLEILSNRAYRFYSQQESAVGRIIHGDSRKINVFETIENKIKWIITSPPYYGMKTYIPDQWLRAWFLGGSSNVDYSAKDQVQHASFDKFIADLKQVWTNLSAVCHPQATMIIRFGAINERKANPLQTIKGSLENTRWEISRIESAGYASEGRRQASYIRHSLRPAIEEHDVWAILQSST